MYTYLGKTDWVYNQWIVESSGNMLPYYGDPEISRQVTIESELNNS